MLVSVTVSIGEDMKGVFRVTLLCNVSCDRKCAI